MIHPDDMTELMLMMFKKSNNIHFDNKYFIMMTDTRTLLVRVCNKYYYYPYLCDIDKNNGNIFIDFNNLAHGNTADAVDTTKFKTIGDVLMDILDYPEETYYTKLKEYIENV